MPRAISIEGNAKSNLGSIQNRLENVEVIKEKKDRTNQLLEFRRVANEDTLVVKLSTTTGSILIKDTDQ